MTSPILITSDTISKLTPRQVEILDLLIEGKSYKQVGQILSISRNAVNRHIRKACWKIGAMNRVQLIVIYVRWLAAQG